MRSAVAQNGIRRNCAIGYDDRHAIFSMRSSTQRWRALWLVLAMSLLISACAPGGTSAGAIATRTVAQSPFTPIAPGWRLYTDRRYGFAIQYPPGATLEPSTSQGSFDYTGWRLASAGYVDGSATLLMTVTPQPGPNLCAEMTHGKSIALRGGISAYQFDNLAPPTPTNITQQPQVAILFISGRLFTIITLSGDPPANTFLERWGTVWSNTLMSYQTGHGPAGAHPCA